MCSPKNTKQPPLSLCLTEFHFLLLRNSQLVAINRLSEETIFEEYFDQHKHGKLRGLAPDTRRDSIWMFSHKFVFEVC